MRWTQELDPSEFKELGFGRLGSTIIDAVKHSLDFVSIFGSQTYLQLVDLIILLVCVNFDIVYVASFLYTRENL